MFKFSHILSSNDADKVHLFSTQFYAKLMNNDANICKWTQRVNIFDKQIHIYPINEIHRHWYLVIVVFPTPNDPYIAIMDSDYHPDDKKETVVDSIKQYLVEEMSRQNVKSISKKGIQEMKTIYPDLPQQMDGSSCGLFVLHFVRVIFQVVNLGELSSLFDDISIWHKNKGKIATGLRHEMAEMIKITAVSQGRGSVKLPDLQYFSTFAEDRAFKRSKAETAKDVSENTRSENSTLENIPSMFESYQDYLRRVEETQQDYSLIWSYDE